MASLASLVGLEPNPDGSGYVVPTELATVSFGLLAGIGGGLAQLIASRRLSGVSNRHIKLSSLALPVILGGGSTALAAYLLPKS